MSNFKDVNILIVESDESLQSQLQNILTNVGYNVTTCGSAEAAIKRFADLNVNIVIVDVKISSCNDYDLLKKIKLEHPDVSIIISTVHADMKSIKESLLNGADEYISKPFKNYEVTMVLERAFWRVISTK